ncbi:MAG: pyridoxal kinase PdxY [Rhodospirillales bacterium]|nr:pyridoxal kinase PdxY [Rhodospirillales bacterium]
MNVLSIQSAVAWGHVGNSAAVFILRRAGHDAWPIDTVHFSNHPGYGRFRGRVVPANEIAALIEGLAELGVLGRIDTVLTGYLGAAEQGPAAARAAAQVRAANPAALWLVDPVIGDKGRVFVQPGIAEFMRDVAAPAADILTPNQFELEFLAGQPARTLPAALAAARQLVAVGGARDRLVIVTGLALTDAETGTLTTLAVKADKAWRVVTPEIAHPGYGAGDAFAAAFLGRYLAGRDIAMALTAAVSAVHAALAHSARTGRRELSLVATQDEFVQATGGFAATAIT